MNDEYVTPRPQWNRGGGDHDQPYRFERHPISYLTTRDFARLLVWRSRIEQRELLRNRSGNPGMETPA